MIYHLEVLLRKVRRWVSRNEWLIALLRLPKSKETETAPGLVLIQIDGLSHTQLGRALDETDNFRVIQSQHARHLGGKKIQKFFRIHRWSEEKMKDSLISVTAMGPLGNRRRENRGHP